MKNTSYDYFKKAYKHDANNKLATKVHEFIIQPSYLYNKLFT